MTFHYNNERIPVSEADVLEEALNTIGNITTGCSAINMDGPEAIEVTKVILGHKPSEIKEAISILNDYLKAAYYDQFDYYFLVVDDCYKYAAIGIVHNSNLNDIDLKNCDIKFKYAMMIGSDCGGLSYSEIFAKVYAALKTKPTKRLVLRQSEYDNLAMRFKKCRPLTYTEMMDYIYVNKEKQD